jgi:hypothetical protein
LHSEFFEPWVDNAKSLPSTRWQVRYETAAKALASTTILTEKYDMYFLLNALECEQIPKYLIVIFKEKLNKKVFSVVEIRVS